MPGKGGGFGGGGFGGGGFGGGRGGGDNRRGGGSQIGIGRPTGPETTSVGPGTKQNKGVGPGLTKPHRVGPGAVGPSTVPHIPTVSAFPLETPEKIQRVLHMILFARLTSESGERLIKDVGFLDEASGERFHMVLAGYSDSKPSRLADSNSLAEAKIVRLTTSKTWYYDDTEFVRQMDLVAENSTWTYKGGTQLIICDVLTPDRKTPSSIEDMFVKGLARLDHVITVGIEELRENNLIRDFDDFFNTVRNLIPRTASATAPGPTWKLSDDLGLSKAGLATEVLTNVFGLKWDKAIESALKLKHFAVRDIRK